MAGHRELAQPRDDGGIEPAAQPDDEPASGRNGDLLP
jgi:hypothetical protein